MADRDLHADAAAYYESLGVRNFEQARHFSALSVEYWL
jgi:hypothetical protein